MSNIGQLERSLLVVAGIIMLHGAAAVSLAHGVINYIALGAICSIFAGFMIVHALLRRMGHAGDPLLLPLTALLVGIGLTTIFRIKPDLFLLQVVWVGVGLSAFLVSVFLSRRLEQVAYFKYICGFIGVSLLLTAIIFGVDIGGNKNWVLLGPVRFQPSEFAKIFIVYF